MLFQKSQFFAFVLSFAITFLVGFCVWDAFLNSGFAIKTISAHFFTAGLQNEIQETKKSEEIKIEEIEPEPESQDEIKIIIAEPTREDILDDIAEKLDIIQAKVDELIAKTAEEEDKDDKEEEEEEEEPELEISCVGQIDINIALQKDLEKIIGVGPATAQKIISARPFYLLDDLLKVSGIGEKTLAKIKEQNCAFVDESLAIFAPIDPVVSGGGDVYYPKILISELQIKPTGQRFIELYNSNNSEIILTNWYLQRKTATGSDYTSFISKTKFLNKIILPNNYFLISEYDEEADIFEENLTITDGNSFVLKNPNREISDVLDLLATITPSTGQTIGRIWDEEFQNYKDSADNSADFEIQIPTPKSQNIKYAEPPLPEILSIEIIKMPNKLSYYVDESLDIFGIEVEGIYSDGSKKIEEIKEENITGFDSSVPVSEQILTINFEGFTAEYKIEILEIPPDTTPPTGTILINNGAEYTNDRNVILTIFAQDDVSEVVEMRIANGSAYKEWESYVIEKEWGLPETNGIKTVRVQFRDSVGNETSPGISDTIILDTKPPIITLNGNTEINLNLGDIYEEFGAETDDGSEIIITGNVDTNTEGIYTFTYDAIDLAGNNATQVIRTIIISVIPEEL